MNQLANIPEISENIMNLQNQMERNGLIGEMIDETFEDNFDMDVDVDEDADRLI